MQIQYLEWPLKGVIIQATTPSKADQAELIQDQTLNSVVPMEIPTPLKHKAESTSSTTWLKTKRTPTTNTKINLSTCTDKEARANTTT